MQTGHLQPRWFVLLCSLLLSSMLFQAEATHLVDHRFTVQGTVRDGTSFPGKLLTGQQVVVRFADSQQLLSSGVTNEHGEYRLILHVHNDDLGKIIVIESQGSQERLTLKFDPNDATNERRARVDLVVFPAPGER